MTTTTCPDCKSERVDLIDTDDDGDLEFVCLDCDRDFTIPKPEPEFDADAEWDEYNKIQIRKKL